MKPHKGGKQHLRQDVEVPVVRSPDLSVPLAPALSAEEKAVFECLHASMTGLTVRQLQSRVSCGRDVIETALESLLDRELVVRLNTIIPSYTCRPGSLPHGG